MLPVNYQSLTNEDLISFDIREEDIVKIIRNLNSAKAHGCDAISIRIVKICDITVSKPLCYLFRIFLSECVIPEAWKKDNVVPIFKKGNRQDFKNYRPISLLPTCVKIFD